MLRKLQLPSLLSLQLWLFLVLLGTTCNNFNFNNNNCVVSVLVSAENRIEIPINVVLDPNGQTGGRVSQVFSHDIKGSGYLNFAELDLAHSYESDGPRTGLDAAVLFLKKKPKTNSVSVDDYIGVTAQDGSTEYCCTKASQQKVMLTEDGTTSNICQLDQIGQLIVKTNENIARVQHRNFTSGGMGGVVIVTETEHMALVFGLCGDNNSYTVQILGNVIWVSYFSTNTLPLQIVVLLLTGYLAFWYHRLMQINADARIQIEEWIRKVLLLAAISMVFQTIVMVLEIYGDNEPTLLEFASDAVTAVSLVAGRCLYLVLAMGLGVITSSLSTVTNTMLGICLGGNVLGLIAIALMDFIERNSIIGIFENLVLLFDIIFLLWIPIATCRTMGYLHRNSGEELLELNLKLVRYRWILKIYFLSIFLSILQFGLFFGDMVTTGGRRYDMESSREVSQIIHLVILWCLAYLWKPNPSQQQYAYVLLEDDENELENENENGDGKLTGMTDLELTEINVVQETDDVDVDVIVHEGSFLRDDEKRVV